MPVAEVRHEVTQSANAHKQHSSPVELAFRVQTIIPALQNMSLSLGVDALLSALPDSMGQVVAILLGDFEGVAKYVIESLRVALLFLALPDFLGHL